MNTEIVPVKLEFNGYAIEQNESNNFFAITINTGSIQGEFVSYGDAVSCSCSVEMSCSNLPKVGVRFEVFFKIADAWISFGRFIITDEPVKRNERTTFTGAYSFMK